MTHFFDRPDVTAAFLERATPPISVDDSNVTSSISLGDVGAALKKLKRGKAAGPDEITNSFYVITQTRLRQFSQHYTQDGWSAACSRRLLVTRIFNV